MPQPNIVVFITDDQTFESISRMPGVFSRIADNGVFFSNAYTSTALCQPGRATILTGQFSHNHGIIDNPTSYTTMDEATLLGKLLNDVGYNTCYVGKYLNNWTTADAVPAGWDEWHATWPQDAYDYNINDNGVVSAKGTDPLDHQTLVVTDHAISFIATATEPFLLMVGFNAPHFDAGSRYEVTPTEDYIDCIPDTREFAKSPDWNLSDVTDKPAYVQALPLIDSTREDDLNRFFRETTESLLGVNNAINQIIDALIAQDKYDNTYIIYTSDNGEMFGEQRIDTGKIVPYESAIHIPLVISGPSAEMTHNGVCTEMVSHVDIAPTILELAGVTSPLTVDGVSLVRYLVDPQAEPVRGYVFMEWNSDVTTPAGNSSYKAVRSKRWKYVEYSTGEQELYDLRDTRFELVNVAGLAENADTVTMLSAMVARGETCTGSECIL